MPFGSATLLGYSSCDSHRSSSVAWLQVRGDYKYLCAVSHSDFERSCVDFGFYILWRLELEPPRAKLDSLWITNAKPRAPEAMLNVNLDLNPYFKRIGVADQADTPVDCGVL